MLTISVTPKQTYTNEVIVEHKEPAGSAALTNTRARTRKLLVDTAIRLFDEGAFPSVTDVAQAAQLSRATAYRYFPSQSALVDAVVGETLYPIQQWQPAQPEVEARIDELLSYAFPLMLKHEGSLRAALHLSLTQWEHARSQHTVGSKDKLVRGNRKAMLQLVTRPLLEEMPQPQVLKVIQALSLVYGSEIFLVMKDIWHCDNAGVEALGKWIAKAIVRQAREDAAAAAS
ncbi:TetR family transcriptional regulator [Erwinia sp. OLTSP20]|uniref:TetR/AcrR family transcriptional regulator n=1 Tax=unclassified Erwinia TaxID=2622719 RepID=UPI000C18F658|nr:MULTISPECIES: TetR/AcrR family transcriptional regulator [unclassified Erwinia]PIJ48890.1 TetR family transcriptional regulator [Erwinia sp. OAMSP11]PIJ74543.1 TetR family transcriptional regulator [Erwinia sp. OLSSP12]PIJ79574.1 TetR family transcriptional regulator [Erwinia sp. OLCASP19]PIJ80359.1 TetR family transcriptional regulator [Erwinia sp. OLMTSP26]PIJ82474.1 TetR family transcriptional regulator [Erwinia sp. OLMDSP33]